MAKVPDKELQKAWDTDKVVREFLMYLVWVGDCSRGKAAEQAGGKMSRLEDLREGSVDVEKVGKVAVSLESEGQDHR